MLERLIKTAQVNCGNDPEEIDRFIASFVETLEKRAANQRGQEFSATQEVLKGMSGALGKGVTGIGMQLGLLAASAISNAVTNSGLRAKFLQAMETAIRRSSILQQADKQKVMSFGETIFKFAPSVATDANILGMVLTNAIHGETLDPMTLQTLQNMERSYRDRTQSQTLGGIRV